MFVVEMIQNGNLNLSKKINTFFPRIKNLAIETEMILNKMHIDFWG